MSNLAVVCLRESLFCAFAAHRSSIAGLSFIQISFLSRVGGPVRPGWEPEHLRLANKRCLGEGSNPHKPSKWRRGECESQQEASMRSCFIRARQRSGEGVVRRNGCPKACFWRVCFSAPLRFLGVLRANLKGAEKKRTLQKRPFGQSFLCTTPSPLLSGFGAPQF